MKANFCEKGDNITSAHLKCFRTLKNKFDVGMWCKKGGKRLFAYLSIHLFVYLSIRFGGGANSTPCLSIRNCSKRIDE